MTQRYAHLRDETFKRGASVAGDLINEIVKENEKSEEANGGKKIENHTS
jgi:hypothetical protein